MYGIRAGRKPELVNSRWREGSEFRRRERGMISIGAAANLCCYCSNKANASNSIISHSNITSKERVVVVWWKWKNQLLKKKNNDRFLIAKSNSRRKTRWWWKWNGDLTSTGTEAGAVLLMIMMILLCGRPATALTIEQTMDTLSNIPQTLSGEDRKKPRIQHPKSRNAERCTGKCLTTCIQGGAGSPGEGPLNARRPLVVFKEGFRSRQYCLVECSDICNLLKEGDDGP